MAGEHDFAPLSEAHVDALADGDFDLDLNRIHLEGQGEALFAVRTIHYLAAELRASRAAMRALVEANDDHTPSGRLRWEAAAAAIRALVAHVGRGA